MAPIRVKKRAVREKEDDVLIRDRLLKKLRGRVMAGRAQGECRPSLGIAPHPR